MNKHKDLICLITAILIISVCCVFPPLKGLSSSAQRLIGIFVGTVFLWISIGISWPSLFGMLSLILLLPEITIKDMLAGSVGNPVITFLIFTFCCSHALEQTAFVKRCAVKFLSMRFARKGPWYFTSVYFFSVLVLGSVMSTIVIVLIYLALNEEIFSLLQIKKGDKFAAMLTMGLVITASISGAMTPIAHVFPVVAINTYKSLSGISISYMRYMSAGIPAALISTVAMIFIFYFVFRPDISCFYEIDTEMLKKEVPPVDGREKAIVTIFFMVVAFWILPDLLKSVLPEISGWFNSMGTAVPAILGSLLLCVLKGKDGRPLLNLRAGFMSVPWECLFMAASALALGAAITNEKIGLSESIIRILKPITESFSGLILVLVLVTITGFMTNLGSNMVTVTIVCTVALPIVLTIPVGIEAGGLTVVLGMASAYAFATPSAMTTVVLGTGSEWTTNSQMAKYGFLTLIPCILAISFVAYPIAAAFC